MGEGRVRKSSVFVWVMPWRNRDECKERFQISKETFVVCVGSG